MHAAMNKMAYAIAVLLTLGIASLSGAGQVENQGEKEIRALEAQLSAAVINADADFFEGILADDFSHTSHTGRFRNKRQWMSDLRRGGAKYTSFKTDDIAVRIYGDTAIVTGRSSPTGTNSRGEPIIGQYRYLRAWIRRAGGWQAIAFQGTRIEGALPDADSNSKKDKE